MSTSSIPAGAPTSEWDAGGVPSVADDSLSSGRDGTQQLLMAPVSHPAFDGPVGRSPLASGHEPRNDAEHPATSQGRLPRRREQGSGDPPSRRPHRQRGDQLLGRDRTGHGGGGAAPGDWGKRDACLL